MKKKTPCSPLEMGKFCDEIVLVVDHHALKCILLRHHVVKVTFCFALQTTFERNRFINRRFKILVNKSVLNCTGRFRKVSVCKWQTTCNRWSIRSICLSQIHGKTGTFGEHSFSQRFLRKTFARTEKKFFLTKLFTKNLFLARFAARTSLRKSFL